MTGTLESGRSLMLPAIDSVAGPSTWPRVTAVLVGLSIAALAGLGFVPWQQSVSGAGRLVAFAPMERQQVMDAPVDGRVERWHVMEGTRVKKGDPVADMADLDPNLPARLQLEKTAALERIGAVSDRTRHLEERVEQLEQSLKNEIAAADFRIQQARDRERAADQSLDAARAKATAAVQNLTRHLALFPKGLVSRRQLEVAQADKDTSAADLRRAEAQLSEARNFLKTAEVERDRTVNAGSAMIRDARASRGIALGELASARQALQPIEVRLTRQATQTVFAPVDGVIFRLAVQPGSAVLKAGDEIASIVPDFTTPVAEVWVAGNDMPLISPGRKVRLQFEGWPAIQFVGWPSVAVGTFGGVVKLVDASDDGKGKFRILVEPDPSEPVWPDSRYLRQGVRAKAWILLDNVSLGFEVWRQFNGFPPVVAVQEPAKAEKRE